jgi:hypothetical protein
MPRAEWLIWQECGPSRGRFEDSLPKIFPKILETNMPYVKAI